MPHTGHACPPGSEGSAGRAFAPVRSASSRSASRMQGNPPALRTAPASAEPVSRPHTDHNRRSSFLRCLNRSWDRVASLVHPLPDRPQQAAIRRSHSLSFGHSGCEQIPAALSLTRHSTRTLCIQPNIMTLTARLVRPQACSALQTRFNAGLVVRNAFLGRLAAHGCRGRRVTSTRIRSCMCLRMRRNTLR